MEKQQVLDGLRKFVLEKFEIGEDEGFTDDTHLFDYGYVDSFGAVEIITFIDDRFGVSISDEDLMLHPLNTLSEIAELVWTRIQER